MVSQEPAKLSWAQVQSGFKSRQFRHVTVAQLVERLIVAQMVEDSSSSGHPNMEGSHSGRVHLPRKQKARKGPRVRIPFLPPNAGIA